MKKLLFIFCLLLPLFAPAQDVKALIHRADSLNARSNHKQALKLYDEAISKVTSYQDTVSKREWFRISTIAGELAGKDYMKYAPDRYFPDGEKFKQQITNLKERSVKYLFTYNPIYLGATGASYYIRDPKKRVQFFPGGYQKLMIWIENNELYVQAFGDNIFKPMNMNNRKLVNFIEAHYSQFSLQEIPHQRTRYNHRLIHEFKFYLGDTFYLKTIDEAENLVNPNLNDAIYLGKLLPQIQTEAANYYKRLKTE